MHSVGFDEITENFITALTTDNNTVRSQNAIAVHESGRSLSERSSRSKANFRLQRWEILL